MDNDLISETKIRKDAFLPYGEMLRSMLMGTYISKADIKRLLAKRGIFVRNSDKDVTVPILMTCLLSPSEFEFLRESQRQKEEKPKHKTQSIYLDIIEEFTLIEAIKDKRIGKELVPKYSNYRILGAPSFRSAGNPNELMLEYEIERINRTKDFFRLKTIHKASIRIEKQGNLLNITTEETSPETQELNNLVTRNIFQKLKDDNYVDKRRRIQKILSSDFSNEGRIGFLLAFCTDDETGMLRFEDITDIDIGPDSDQPLPTILHWMENKVHKMSLSGNQLQDASIISNPNIHKSLKLAMVEAKYEFDYKDARGICVIQYGFPDYLKTNDQPIEFQMHIEKITWRDGKSYPRKDVERDLFRRYDKIKKENHQKYADNLSNEETLNPSA